MTKLGKVKCTAKHNYNISTNAQPEYDNKYYINVSSFGAEGIWFFFMDAFCSPGFSRKVKFSNCPEVSALDKSTLRYLFLYIDHSCSVIFAVIIPPAFNFIICKINMPSKRRNSEINLSINGPSIGLMSHVAFKNDFKNLTLGL